jgi:DNA invertase Pin-like site-specific DNA recombinase
MRQQYTATDITKILTRAALYIRVSTEEQAIHGYSLEAQQADLEAYCERNGLKIAGTYIDAGKSASKKPLKREALQSLLKDVQAGKIDIILFIKLDRWSRNMADYCDMDRVLKKHGVDWKTTQEEYDTTTPNGRFAIHIMVAKAENEAAVTSERVKFVLANKRKNGEACFGGAVKPYGYMKQKDADGKVRLVIDPDEYDMMADFWKYCKQYNSVVKAGELINEQYGMSRNYKAWLETFHNEFYRGSHRGVENFCPAYISQEEWEALKKTPTVRKNEQDRVYLFTGLIKCPVCGATMRSTFKTYKPTGQEWYGYKCYNAINKACPMTKQYAELKTEKWLLKNIEEKLSQYIITAEAEEAKPKKKPKKDPLKVAQDKLRRLNVMYMAGNKTDEEYLKEAAELNEEIKKAQVDHCEIVPKDLTKLKEFLASDFTTTYQSLNREEKRRLWRSILTQIHFEGNNPVDVDFRV